MTMTVGSSTLKVPGATLYHEVQGAGPVLLIIPGGPQDAGVFAGLSRHLAARHTVVAFDPRGNSRSPFDDEPDALDVHVQADDAAALIRSVSDGPVDVFGTSGGAHIGLDLAARHPELVDTLVAHEPPTILLLDDPSPALAADQEIVETYRRDGVDAAMERFFELADLDGGGEPDGAGPGFEMAPEDLATVERVRGNFDYWLAHGMVPLSRYRPAVDVLRSGQPRVVVGIGEASAGQPIHDMGTALARALGIEPMPFPGDHLGFETHAEAFAATLQEALDDRSRRRLTR